MAVERLPSIVCIALDLIFLCDQWILGSVLRRLGPCFAAVRYLVDAKEFPWKHAAHSRSHYSVSNAWKSFYWQQSFQAGANVCCIQTMSRWPRVVWYLFLPQWKKRKVLENRRTSFISKQNVAESDHVTGCVSRVAKKVVEKVTFETETWLNLKMGLAKKSETETRVLKFVGC